MTDIASMGAFPIGDYLAILRRQRGRMLAVGLGFLVVAATLIAIWPATYRSMATILISQIDIPPNLVTTTTSTFADQQVQAIQQRVTTTPHLTAIIEKRNLYADQRGTVPMSQIVDAMRANIGILTISADTTTATKVPQAAIAFNLWYDAGDPKTSQQVTSDLVALYLAENDRDRESRAAVATNFLKSESLRLQESVQSLEAAVEAFKTEHIGYMPEDKTDNVQALDRLDSQVLQLTHDARGLRDKRTLIQAEMAKTPRYLQPTGADAAMSPEAQLALLEGRRAALMAKYGEKHPDVVAVDRQITALKSTGVRSNPDSVALGVQIQTASANLAAAKQKYGSNSPDVDTLQRQLNAAEAQLAAMSSASSPASGMSNPTYADLQIQLAGVESELETTESQLRAAQEKQANLEDRLAKTPMVERQFAGLQRDYQTTLQRYLEVRGKQNEAELAGNLESDRVGETLSLAEPPVEPAAPVSPNRLLLFAIAVFASIIAAAATGLLSDAFDGRVHGWRQVMTISGQSPFTIVPVIQTARDRMWNRVKIVITIVLTILSMVVAVMYINAFIYPLEAKWAALVEAIGGGAPPPAQPAPPAQP
jgi:protein tyrosine kinase modulator